MTLIGKTLLLREKDLMEGGINMAAYLIATTFTKEKILEKKSSDNYNEWRVSRMLPKFKNSWK